MNWMKYIIDLMIWNSFNKTICNFSYQPVHYQQNIMNF